MTVSRREILKASAWAGAALLVPLDDALAQRAVRELPAEAYGDVLYRLTRSAFQSALNSTFSVRSRGRLGRSQALRLVDVSDVSAAVAAGTVGHEECFAVRFLGSGAARLGQGTYAVRHKTLGSMQIFLVPERAAKSSQGYIAIFNRQTV